MASDRRTRTEGERLEAYADAAAIISEAMGIIYEPELLDAGFEAEIDARNVMAFREITDFTDGGGLCPACATRTDYLFYSPWSAEPQRKTADPRTHLRSRVRRARHSS